MIRDCLWHARSETRVGLHPRPAHAPNHRMQFLADACGWYRGRMVTRAGVRCMDLKCMQNSNLFFRDVCLYLGQDHYAEASKYLSPALAA